MFVNDQRQADRLSKFTKSSRQYLLPVFVGELDGSDNELHDDLSEAMEHSVYHSAWSTLYTLGREGSDTIKEIAKGSQSMTHGNKGKRHVNEEREQVYNKITDTLTDLQENFLTPFATRIVRDNTRKLSLRDNNEYVYLPPSFLKRQCYLGVYHEAGWKPAWINRAKGKLKPIREWQPREVFFLTAEQAESSGGEVVEPIVSWRLFRRHWAAHFPKLKVRAKGEDTCADCYLLKLKLARFAKQKVQLLDTLTVKERQEDTKNVPGALDILPAPGLSAKKANECKHEIVHLR